MLTCVCLLKEYKDPTASKLILHLKKGHLPLMFSSEYSGLCGQVDQMLFYVLFKQSLRLANVTPLVGGKKN